jgi:N-acylglucosamine 2-epimerase
LKIDRKEAGALRSRYNEALFDDVIPFWLSHGLDRENGGFFTGLDRSGALIESDKSVWFQGRMAWTFSTLYADFGRKAEHLEAARRGIEFLEGHCFDADGKMFFRVTREGRPLVKRKRYWFSEAFAIVAHAAYARATGDASHVDRARELLARVDRYRREPGLLEPKWDQATRPSIGYAEPMILLAVNQELRKADPARSAEYGARIDGHIAEMRLFIKDDMGLVLEQAGPKGEFQDHFEGRQLNPGHALESAWFILAEARHRKSAELRALGLKVLDWMWERGWDEEGGGGIIYFRDALGRPPTEYWQDMKFWWPQNEATIAALMAYAETGEERYATMFRKVDAYAEARFRDHEKGEWYGYLHRDGTVATDLKGNMYKGCFHVPRMYMTCLGLLDEMIAKA